MPFLVSAFSIFTGAGVGFFYGFCFSNKVIIKFFTPAHSFSNTFYYFLSFFLFSFLRFLFIAFFFVYILHAFALKTILVIPSFLVGFWISILAKRTLDYGK